MARLKKRGNTWYADFDDEKGKRIVKTTKIPVLPSPLPKGRNERQSRDSAKAQAKILADALEENHQKGDKTDTTTLDLLVKYGLTPTTTKCEQVENYLYRFKEQRTHTVGAIERDGKAIAQFLAFLGEKRKLPMNCLTKAIADDFLEHELKRVSSGTVKRYRESLSCAFNRAVDEEIITHNPFKRSKLSKKRSQDRTEKEAFTQEQIKKLLQILPKDWADMVKVCLCTGGQRLGDIVNLQWNQISFDKKTISIKTQKMGKNLASIPILPELENVLRNRYERKQDNYIFPMAAESYRRNGHKVSALSAEFNMYLKTHGFLENTNSVKKAGDRRNVAPLSFHSLRASVVTILRSANYSADLCRTIVGHDSEEIERSYFRPDKNQIYEAMEKVGSLIC